jgi:hypothetical protein
MDCPAARAKATASCLGVRVSVLVPFRAIVGHSTRGLPGSSPGCRAGSLQAASARRPRVRPNRSRKYPLRPPRGYARWYSSRQTDPSWANRGSVERFRRRPGCLPEVRGGCPRTRPAV